MHDIAIAALIISPGSNYHLISGQIYSLLKDHPFAVEAFFNSSNVFAFAVPKEELQAMIPPCLELDLFEDKWAFLAVAMVDTAGLRPKGFPKFMGNDFFLIGYRIFVRYTNRAGKKLRGLYIIKSETNKKKMEFFGNIFTHYHYTTTDISVEKNGTNTDISSERSRFRVAFSEAGETSSLPPQSPFSNWKEARRFAGPLPFTFTYDAERREVLIIEGVRSNWIPEPLEVSSCRFRFLDDLQLKGAVLANAFTIKNIPYYWKKGKKEKWNP